MELQSDLEKLLDALDIVKELNADLKDIETSHGIFTEIQEMKKQLKLKQDELKQDPDIENLREERDTARERMLLLKEILVTKMLEGEAEEVTIKGKRAVISKGVKIEKVKKF